jgi:hypothetical protein
MRNTANTQNHQPPTRGSQKNETGDPRGGWVGQRPKKDQSQIWVFDIPKGCLNFPQRELLKNVDKKTQENLVFGFLSIFCKTFST